VGPSGPFALPQAIQAALTESEHCIAETNQAFAQVAQLEAEVENVAKEFPEKAARLGVQVGRIAYNQTGSAVAGLGYGLGIGLGVAAVGGVISYVHGLWKKFRVEQLLADLLEQKQALARSRLSALRALQPTLERLLDTLGRALGRDASIVLPVERYPLGVEMLSGMKRLFDGRIQTGLALQALRYMDAEMNAWLQGHHQSSASRPRAERSFVDTVNLVLASGSPIDDSKTPIFERATNGRLFLLREGIPGTLNSVAQEVEGAAKASRSLHSLARTLAVRRICRWFLPWTNVSRRFRSLDKHLLGPASAVKSASIGLFAKATVTIAGVLALPLLVMAWSDVKEAIGDPDPCVVVEQRIATSMVSPFFGDSIELRQASCAKKLTTEGCKSFLSWLDLGEKEDLSPVRLTEEQASLFSRLKNNSAELVAADLQTERKTLPCADESVGDQVWNRLMRRAARSPGAWLTATSLSPEVTIDAASLTPETKVVLQERTRDLAELAARPGRHADVLALAKRFCDVAKAIAPADGKCRKVLESN
jgi:hypothetical protein